MSRTSDPKPDAPTLRRQAEQSLERESGAPPGEESLDDMRTMLHELRVHEIELEMQNDELRKTQGALEESRAALATSEARYRNLYDFAPVAYVSLDRSGAIAEANLAAAAILGALRTRLTGTPFTHFIAPQSQDLWYQERRRRESTHQTQSFELRLRRLDDREIDVQVVVSTRVADGGVHGGTQLGIVDITALRDAERKLAAAVEREVSAADRERRRLAEALHDDVGQLLSLLTMKLRALVDTDQPPASRATMDEMAQIISQARTRLTSLSFEMSPPLLFDVGLTAAAEWLADDLEQKFGLRVHIVESDEMDSLGDKSRLMLFRVLRELLINVAKHAGTGAAEVRIQRDNDHVRLDVEDTGTGFETGKTTESGYGLLSIRSQIEGLGGTLNIYSVPGDGTHATVVVPLDTPGSGKSKETA